MNPSKDKKENRLDKLNQSNITNIRNELLDKIFKIEAKLTIKYKNEVKLLRFTFSEETKIKRYLENSVEDINIYGFIVIAIKENNYCELIYQKYDNINGKLGKLLFNGVTYGFIKCNKITTKNLNVEIDVCLNKNQRDCIVTSRIISDNDSRDSYKTTLMKTTASKHLVKLKLNWKNECDIVYSVDTTIETIDTATYTYTSNKTNDVLNIIIFSKLNNLKINCNIKTIKDKTIQTPNNINLALQNFNSNITKCVSAYNDNGNPKLKRIKCDSSNNINLEKMNND